MMKSDPRPLPATYAAICFKGVMLDPAFVSCVMETEPTFSYKKGDLYNLPRRSSERKRSFGIWIYSTRNVIKSSSLKTHITVIEDKILGAKSVHPYIRLEKINSMVSTHGLELAVDVYWYGAYLAKLPTLSQSLYAVVAMAGGEVHTDFQTDCEAYEVA